MNMVHTLAYTVQEVNMVHTLAYTVQEGNMVYTVYQMLEQSSTPGYMGDHIPLYLTSMDVIVS